MGDIRIIPSQSLGYGFIPEEFLPDGADEYHFRNRQSTRPADSWRKLRPEEIEVLVKNANTCDDWGSLLVDEQFNPMHVKNCEFHGLVRIGRISDASLQHHDLRVPIGLTNSRIISCDIGDDCAVHNVRYLSHYILADRVLLLNIDEMHVSNHAKFGNGFVKEGEDPSVRIWMDVGNEAGGRAICPFHGMTAADATLWSRYRDDTRLMDRLAEITQNQFDSRRGYYGQIGTQCVVKNSRIIKDVNVGACAYIKGANKLKNLTIDSSDAEPTQIGEGVELVNGIISPGCKIFYGCKAVRFVMGPHSNLKYGARLIHSYLGDNATVSCCEILNNLIFPVHEQHHNNSFLVAATVMGQSNIAAGATIGSNHNSRANDGEILAGRGFWPGLCTSLKHSCRFASFTLLAKADYPAELNISLPFSLVSNDVANDRLLVMPAYWWQYNMYALMRNAWKFRVRDQRVVKTQHIEFELLAPDTVEEIFTARRLLEIWTSKAYLHQSGEPVQDYDEPTLQQRGTALLEAEPYHTVDLDILGEQMERSRREVIVLKARSAWWAYRQMIFHYVGENLLDWLDAHAGATLPQLHDALTGPREKEWVNLGGQLLTASQVDQLRRQINAGELNDWPAIHATLDAYWETYPTARQAHALAALLDLTGERALTAELWATVMDEAAAAWQSIAEQTERSRAKDYVNPFRQFTSRNADEFTAVFGTVEDNSFVRDVRRQRDEKRQRIDAARSLV